tara:strand:+ start:1178 stop:1612 length:435 start_codon:yes stop_codon:yes gene_type:complete
MIEDNFRGTLEESYRTFIQYNGDANVSDGWKLSIQGKTLDDSMYLYNELIGFLMITKCSFKFATKRLINYEFTDEKRKQQSNKLLTIYIPNGVDPKSFAELVYLHIEDYTGGDDVKHPDTYEHYKNAIYYRNDIDEEGNYIKAN